MQTKTTRAFRTISEASDELDLKPHVLRFWEAKFPDLTPLTRAGGRRFYRPEDIDFLRGLRILLHDEKHKIKDVQKLIKVRGAQSVVDLGQSSVNVKPSRPIEERDLVPKHIKPAIIKPAAAPKAAPAPVAQPVVVPFTPAAPQPAAQPAPQPAASADTQAAGDAPKADPAVTADLENALDRLSSLRSRWQKFT